MMQTSHLRWSLLGALVGAAALLLGGAGPAGAAFPGANGKIAFTSDRDGNREVYVMNADGSGQTQLTDNPIPVSDHGPAWSPDGQKIAFTSNRDGDAEVYVMNADGSGVTQLTANDASDGDPAWSPDGQKIAFMSNRDSDFEVYVMNADGSGQTQLTTNTLVFDAAPAWSPDGQKIAFTSNRDGNSEVYVMNADGSGQTQLTANDASDGDPAWSPDGQKIAFTSNRDGDAEVYVMNADGSGSPTRLTNNTASDADPAWSPDGRKLAFTSARDGHSDVYVMNADGSGPVDRLTTTTALFTGNFGPDWQPLPSADLSLGLAASPSTLAGNGKPLTYTITVANAGPTAAKNVVVTDTLPAQTRFASVSPSQGSCSAPAVGSVGTVVCSLGTLAKDASANVKIVVKVVARKTTVVNTASVTSATADPNPTNNSATVATPVK